MPNTAMPAEDNADRPPFVGGRNAIAMGTASKALADRAIALGAGSPALERDATAVGRDAVAIGTPAVVAGGVATAHDHDEFGSVVGSSEPTSHVAGVASTAIGGGAKAVDLLTTAGPRLRSRKPVGAPMRRRLPPAPAVIVISLAHPGLVPTLARRPGSNCWQAGRWPAC
ncbi:hypothetical protein LMG919_15550 [Xanthomonas vesicatoria]|nr:hypothetical protein [Xanthomonas vesicatoria]KTF33994.1 hypothetical protein LMG919_15550 [Xanthomonas vesicatoria]MCC8609572.1 hypothetical protein [Xanthomonas vesicatoria]MCC8678336.1 hypothetical protein [Xanthomonas vesicatoria]